MKPVREHLHEPLHLDHGRALIACTVGVARAKAQAAWRRSASMTASASASDMRGAAAPRRRRRPRRRPYGQRRAVFTACAAKAAAGAARTKGSPPRRRRPRSAATSGVARAAVGVGVPSRGLRGSTKPRVWWLTVAPSGAPATASATAARSASPRARRRRRISSSLTICAHPEGRVESRSAARWGRASTKISHFALPVVAQRAEPRRDGVAGDRTIPALARGDHLAGVKREGPEVAEQPAGTPSSVTTRGRTRRLRRGHVPGTRAHPRGCPRARRTGRPR
jgi:hypothetical protein